MAVATAKCTCRECGKNFESTKKLPNRAQADEWREWAEDHFDLCPDCYKEMKRAEEIALADEITAKYNLPQGRYSSERTYFGSWGLPARTDWRQCGVGTPCTE